MGRTPQPAALKLLHGRGPGKDSAGRPVTTVPSERIPPTMPKGLPAEAQREWKRIVPLLDNLGVLAGELHRGAVIAYVRLWADYVDLAADVAAHGRTSEVTVRDNAGGSSRKRTARPEVAMLRDTRADMLRYAKELGLTPASEAAAYASAKATEASTDNTPNPWGD